MSFFNKPEELILLNAKSVVVGFSGGVDSTLALNATMQFLEKHNKKSCLPNLLQTHGKLEQQKTRTHTHTHHGAKHEQVEQ